MSTLSTVLALAELDPSSSTDSTCNMSKPKPKGHTMHTLIQDVKTCWGLRRIVTRYCTVGGLIEDTVRSFIICPVDAGRIQNILDFHARKHCTRGPDCPICAERVRREVCILKKLADVEQTAKARDYCLTCVAINRRGICPGHEDDARLATELGWTMICGPRA